MPTKPRPKTPTRGAADIIAQVIEHIELLPKMCVMTFPSTGNRVECIDRQELLLWLRWDARAKRKGGLGKR